MNARSIYAKKEINDAYQTMGGIVTDGGTGTGTGGGSNLWGSTGFWSSVNHLFDTIGGMFGRPNYGNYPPPQYSQGPAISPALTYAGIGLFLLITLALVFKIVK